MFRRNFASAIAIILMISSFGFIAPSANAASCQSATGRIWKLVNKNPDNYKGKNYWVYGEITQFDAATGTGSFRADVSGDNKFDGDYFFGGDNSYVFGSSKTLSKFVNEDVFKACVTVKGSLTYDLAHGGSLTVPKLQVISIKLLGSTS